MGVEESHFLLHGSLDRDLSLDVFLGSVLDTDVTKTKGDLLVHDGSLGVSSLIHNIDLGDDTDGSNTLRVNSACHSQTFLSSHISVGGNDTKNNCSRVANISLGHTTSDLLDVLGLSCDRNESDTWQIDQGEIRASVGVHVQHDGVIHNI